MAGWPLTVSSTRHTPSPGSGAPTGELSCLGMMGWNPCRLTLILVVDPPGAAREKPGLPPTWGGE